MPGILVFDVNETLLSLDPLRPLLRRVLGDEGALDAWFAQVILHAGVLTLAVPTCRSASWAARCCA